MQNLRRYQIVGQTVYFDDNGSDLASLAHDFQAQGYQVVFPTPYRPQLMSAFERTMRKGLRNR